MNPHKCDMCGLYLVDGGEVCRECIKAAEVRRKATNNYKDSEYKEDPENEHDL